MPSRNHKEDGMTAKVGPIPEGCHAVTPYLCIQGAASAIDFYMQAFGATEVMRAGAPGGKIGHARAVFTPTARRGHIG